MTKHEQRILNLISLKPNGGLTSIRELRAEMGPKLSKATFDKAVLSLADAGQVALHKHDYPAGLTADEKAGMIRETTTATFAGKTATIEVYYIGVGLR